MGHPKQTLEPVLENSLTCQADITRRCEGNASPCRKQIGATPTQNGSKSGTGRVSKSFKPMTVLGKLRDRYVKMMNEMSMGGDLAGAATYSGCPAGPDYPQGPLDQKIEQEMREVEALRQQLVVLQRERQGQTTAGA